MNTLEQVLYLNIGLEGGKCHAAILSDALYHLAANFTQVYSVEVVPGKDEPTLVIAAHTRDNFVYEVEQIARILGQDSIAYVYKIKGAVVEHGFIGLDVQRLTWDESKFITPRLYWQMIQ